jgi:hypothetical protein
MVLQLEYPATIRADTLENAITIQDTMVENRNLRLCQGDELSIQIHHLLTHVKLLAMTFAAMDTLR